MKLVISMPQCIVLAMQHFIFHLLPSSFSSTLKIHRPGLPTFEVSVKFTIASVPELGRVAFLTGFISLALSSLKLNPAIDAGWPLESCLPETVGKLFNHSFCMGGGGGGGGGRGGEGLVRICNHWTGMVEWNACDC